MRICGCEEHDVTNHCHWRSNNEENHAFVCAPRQEWEEDCEEGTDDIRWDGMKLLADDCVLGVDGLDNCRSEEGQSLDSDVVEQEDEGC